MEQLPWGVVAEEVWATVVRGGWVMLPLFLLGVMGWFLVFRQLSLFSLYRKNELPRAVDAVAELYRRSDSDEQGEQLIAEERARAVPFLERHLSTIARLAAVAPLLGLLGTVTGMRSTFATIMQHGFGNPVLLADGISEALLTTQSGLVIAFPLLLIHSRLRSGSKRLIDQIDQLLLAERNRHSVAVGES